RPLAAVPSLAPRAALEPVTAQEVLLLRLHVAEARDVEAVRAIAECRPVQESRVPGTGAGAEVMVHDIPAERATGIREAVREGGALRVEEQAHRLDGRCVQEHDARRVLDFMPRD